MANKLTKRQLRKLRNEQLNNKPKNSLEIKHISPRTENQKLIFDAFHEKDLMIHGYPGTGKTFVALYLALEEILSGNSSYKMIKIFRSAVATRNIGYLPGKVDDKMESFESPYISICEELFGRSDAYGILKHKGLINFYPTSFIRGCTYNDCIVIVDECQNLSWHEAASLATRYGQNCKYVFCGDSRQSDLKNNKLDIHKLLKVCEGMSRFECIEMDIDDIIRSGFVKEFIIRTDELGYAL